MAEFDPGKVEALIFDLGNVFVHVEKSESVRALCRKIACSPDDERLQIFTDDALMDRFQNGELTSEQFFEVVTGTTGINIDYAFFVHLWNHIFTPIAPMIDLIGRLGRFTRVLLSNTNSLHVEYLMKRFSFFRHFDHMIFSHEVRLLKPDQAIFKLTLDRAGCPAEKCLFIDDACINVEGALQAGIHALQFTGHESLMESFRLWGWVDH